MSGIDLYKHIGESEKHVGDVISASVVTAAFLEGLPVIALFLTIVWTCIRIYETTTIQKMLGKDKDDGKTTKSE